MPAVGILKKSPHPDPPLSLDRVKPPRPPKPKRGIPPPPLRPADIKISQDVVFADEDEPTTEESYDYKDIDFASDIFDWRIPPPRPKPPRQQANGVAHSVSDSVPVVVSETLAVAYDTRASAVEQRLEPVAEEEVQNKTEAKPGAGEAVVKADRLALFLAEHEGQELTMEDVRQLELLLDDAEGGQSEQEHDQIACDEEGQKYQEDIDDAGRQEFEDNEVLHNESDAVMLKCNGEDLKHDDEPHGTGKVTCVRFSDQNGLDGDSGNVRGEIPDEEMDDDRPAQHPHYGIVQFFHDRKMAKKAKAKDSGMYEPVGRQDLRFVRPDMSGYKPPEPSDVGDPFSWRRREKNHQYLYGYESMDRSDEHTPAMDKILGGCQEVEDLIKQKDLTPPGMLFDSLGRKKRVRKVRPPSPPSRPPPPVPPKMRAPSPLPPIPTEPEHENDEPKTEDGDQTQVDTETQMDIERQIEMERQMAVEKQILTDLSFVESLVDSVSVKEDVLVAGSMSDGCRGLTAVPKYGSVEAEIEDLIVPMDASRFLTGGVHETAGADIGSSYALPSDDQEDENARKTEVGITQVAPKRVSRRDSAKRRPPRPAPPCIVARPIPPERRKRVASAEPPLTAFEREQENLMQRPECVAPPRNKAKRSVSFHTADEIRKRIDIQAQNYLRTPRRKDRLSCTYMATPTSASATLTYGSLRRQPRRPLTPVYSHVNKDILRRKEMGVQTNGIDSHEDDEDVESLPPIPPPKLRDVEMVGPHDVDADHEDLSPEPITVISGDSEVPAKFSVATEFLVESTPDSKSIAESISEDSVVPQTFLNLSMPEDKATMDHEADCGKTAAAGGPDPDTQLTPSPARPLPPPPAPPRHRGTKAKPFTLDGPVVICGIVPKGQEGVSPGKMAVLPDLKVLRLSVVQLDASMIRVGQIEAEHMVARKLDAVDLSRTPTPTSQRPPDPDPNQSDRTPRGGSDASTQQRSDDECGKDGQGFHASGESEEKDGGAEQPKVPGNEYGNDGKYEAQTNIEPEIAKLHEDWTQRLQAPPHYDPSHIRVASPVEGFNVWDGEYLQDRAECASPTNTVTSTTSGSASYVTCDETLHEGSDVTADGLDAGSVDGDFAFGLDEDIDGRGTGCSTPTGMDETIGSDIPLVVGLLDVYGPPPIFAPPSEPYRHAPPSAAHLHAQLPMDTDMDENFNSFGGDDSRDPSNTVGI